MDNLELRDRFVAEVPQLTSTEIAAQAGLKSKNRYATAARWKTALFKTVRLDVVESRSVSRITPKRDLLLAGLFAPDLKVWGLSRGELIETPKSTYGQTSLWAQAIHRAQSNIDGLIWTSRQCDPDQCVILFEDRVGERDFEIHDCIAVSADASLLLELRGFGQRAGITIIS